MGLFGGDSSSSTTNLYEQNTQTLTARDGGSLTANNIKAAEGSQVIVTDGGAVKNALDFSSGVSKDAFGYSGQLTKTAMDFVSKANQQITASGQSMFDGALATVRDQNKLLTQAYQNGQAGDQTQLKYAGFAVVGLAVAAAAVIAFKGK